MRKLPLIALLLVSACYYTAAQTFQPAGEGTTSQTPPPIVQRDSSDFAKLDSMLVYYSAAIAAESVESKQNECSFLIESVNDPSLSRHIALWLWDFYKESKLMGDEAVAIYIFDNWFKTKKIEMRSDMDYLEAEIFASFNRSTLLGMKAPEVSLWNPSGRLVSMPEEGSISILFFYDTACAKCQLEAKLLPDILKEITFPARFYAVYCGSDRKAWRKFRSQFKIRNRKLGIVHLWDPKMDTDYLRLYGVISTPRLYVCLQDNEIVGRRLELESLKEIIHYICVYYGKEEIN